MAAEGKSDRGPLCCLSTEVSFTNPRITKTSNIDLQERKAMSASKAVKNKAIVLEAWICGHPDI
jgi:hypothetical protein